MAKTKAQLVDELKALGVEDFDENATNDALQALIDANQPDEDADDVEEDTSDDAEDTQEDETEEDDSDVEEDEDDASEDESDDSEDDSETDEAAHSVAVIKKGGKIIKTFTARLDGRDWEQRAINYKSQNKGTTIEFK